jgi:hypothetical protein
MKNLVTNLAGAIGSKYLKNHNELVFVEYGGFISKLSLVQPLATIVSQGTTTINGTWFFDCKTGTNVSTAATADLWWEQIDAVNRQMVPQGIAQIVNVGQVNFSQLTPAAMQSFNYSTTPIIGNNNATNKLVAGDVFCVQTIEGYYTKIGVVTYGYDLQIEWVTYQLNASYAHIGIGYNQPEDIFVLADEATAYVTERTGDLVKVNLANANRNVATVVCTGLNTPQQLWVDEANKQAYVVEYANPGRLIRVNLTTGVQTVLYNGLNLAVGLILSSDLVYAYVTEQGLSGISRIELSTGTKTLIASGLTAPFYLTWSDATESRLLVAERDPANNISIVDVTKTTGNVNLFIGGTATRPSSVTVISPGAYCVAANSEIDEYFLNTNPNNYLYKGIGYVAWNFISNGYADTTTLPAYPYQFPKNSPFGGSLPVNIDHYHAWNSGVMYYKVLVDNQPRFDSWTEVRMDPSTGYYDIIEVKKPDANGFYAVHNPLYSYLETDLGCQLDSTTLSNNIPVANPASVHQLVLEFFDINHNSIPGIVNMGNPLFINNQQCVASIDMPMLGLNSADPNCGYLKYTATTQQVSLQWVATHPMGFATYSYGIIKGANGFYSLQGALVPPTPSFNGSYANTVAAMLGTCPGVAAFAESLYVATTVINGIGRQSQYDASQSVAFCLAP